MGVSNNILLAGIPEPKKLMYNQYNLESCDYGEGWLKMQVSMTTGIFLKIVAFTVPGKGWGDVTGML